MQPGHGLPQPPDLQQPRRRPRQDLQQRHHRRRRQRLRHRRRQDQGRSDRHQRLAVRLARPRRALDGTDPGEHPGLEGERHARSGRRSPRQPGRSRMVRHLHQQRPELPEEPVALLRRHVVRRRQALRADHRHAQADPLRRHLHAGSLLRPHPRRAEQPQPRGLRRAAGRPAHRNADRRVSRRPLQPPRPREWSEHVRLQRVHRPSDGRKAAPLAHTPPHVASGRDMTIVRRPVARSLDELLAGVTSREHLKSVDSKSGANFERVVIDGTSYVVKHFAAPDWLAEGSRDTSCRSVTLFEDGVYDATGDIVDSTVVSVARLGVGSWPAAMLMRDASADFVPVDAAVDLDTHRALLDAMAGLHARFWENPPDTTYMPLAVNYEFLSPRRALAERESGGDRSDVLRAVGPGWAQVKSEAPPVWSVVAALLDDPAPLVKGLGRGPSTFLHGDWKMGNLGRGVDGRVVIVDWDRPMAASPVIDLGWYVAVNCDRLPESKDATLDTYRPALERRGVATESWWDEQVELGLLGAFLQLGWSKAGQPEELSWWTEVVVQAASRL